ncbi:ATP synthase subunit I [Oxalobacter vibrioformis]|uniref:ATP synthase subunit I n=1 Tax=Oxalobacter vibrioformis TaxID=933080 RepID=A0A9E9P2G1_9BURK|nr:ATP synthase subunit I [Oxalobacter vibrioformis]WAW08968.1 ATP synthase subunit I [Oxalobacter vibrioformis]
MKWAKVILWQLIITGGVTLLAGLVGGTQAGISAILAAGSSLIPNIVMFVGLELNDQLFKKSGFAVLFVLQFVKFVTTIILIVCIFWLYKDVHWFYFLVSFVITLKSYIFLLSRIKS